MDIWIWSLIGVGIATGFTICIFCAMTMVCLLSITRSLIQIASRLDYRITNLERR